MLEIENRKIALVGNAESIFSAEYGEFIDSHDIVFRINFGIFIKNSYMQGSRTDVWFIMHSFLPRQFQVKFPNYAFDIKHVLCNKKLHSQSTIDSINFDHNLPTLTDLYVECERETLIEQYGHSNPSSGLLCLSYIYNRSPAMLHLFGFDWKETITWYHSIEEIENDNKNKTHNWALEKEFIRKNYLTKENVSIY